MTPPHQAYNHIRVFAVLSLGYHHLYVWTMCG